MCSEEIVYFGRDRRVPYELTMSPALYVEMYSYDTPATECKSVYVIRMIQSIVCTQQHSDA